MATYFRCTRCGKDITHHKTRGGVCGECWKMEALRIETIEQYNDYLRGSKV